MDLFERSGEAVWFPVCRLGPPVTEIRIADDVITWMNWKARTV